MNFIPLGKEDLQKTAGLVIHNHTNKLHYFHNREHNEVDGHVRLV